MMTMDLGEVKTFIEPLLQPSVLVITALIFVGTLALILDYMRKEKKRKADELKGKPLLTIQDMGEIKPFKRPEQASSAPAGGPDANAPVKGEK